MSWQFVCGLSVLGDVLLAWSGACLVLIWGDIYLKSFYFPKLILLREKDSQVQVCLSSLLGDYFATMRCFEFFLVWLTSLQLDRIHTSAASQSLAFPVVIRPFCVSCLVEPPSVRLFFFFFYFLLTLCACPKLEGISCMSSLRYLCISVQWNLQTTTQWVMPPRSRHYFPVIGNRWGFITSELQIRKQSATLVLWFLEKEMKVIWFLIICQAVGGSLGSLI